MRIDGAVDAKTAQAIAWRDEVWPLIERLRAAAVVTEERPIRGMAMLDDAIRALLTATDPAGIDAPGGGS